MSSPSASTSDTGKPLLTIVVPSEGRREEIGDLVASLAVSWNTYVERTGELRAPAELVHLVFVDSSEPPLDTVTIASWDASWMSVARGTRNVRQKRNQGAGAASSAWIAFIDSDCLATPDYVITVLSAISKGQGRCFAGRVEFRGHENAVWRIVAASGLISPETQTAGEGEVSWCATANLIIERALFAALDGFDETLPFRLGGDDVDLGLRLRRSGNALRVLPDAQVVHPKKPWSMLSAILKRTWRWGRVEYHLGLRHPEKLRPMPPFFLGAMATMCAISVTGALVTSHASLMLMPLLWIAVTTLLSSLLTRKPGTSLTSSYLAGWLERIYHLGAATEHLRAGSVRFLWEGFILEERLEFLFPAESQQSWSNVLAAVCVAVAGMLIVSR